MVFLGKVKNPIEPLLISDLLMLPSETESFGLVALEAMAAGVPVISTNVGGLARGEPARQNRHLCEVGDVEGMAKRRPAMCRKAMHFPKLQSASPVNAPTFHH